MAVLNEIKQIRLSLEFLSNNSYELHTPFESACAFNFVNIFPSLLPKSVNFSVMSLEIAEIRVTFVVIERSIFTNGCIS